MPVDRFLWRSRQFRVQLVAVPTRTTRDAAIRLMRRKQDRRAVSATRLALHRSKADRQMLPAKASAGLLISSRHASWFLRRFRRSTSHSRHARRRHPCRRTVKLGRSAGGRHDEQEKDPRQQKSRRGEDHPGQRRCADHHCRRTGDAAELGGRSLPSSHLAPVKGRLISFPTTWSHQPACRSRSTSSRTACSTCPRRA